MQISLPSGERLRQSFPSTSLLSDVIKYVGENSRVDTSAVDVVQPYPPVSFSSADFARTLRDLNLTPSGTLALKPQKSRGLQKGGRRISILAAMFQFRRRFTVLIVFFCRIGSRSEVVGSS